MLIGENLSQIVLVVVYLASIARKKAGRIAGLVILEAETHGELKYAFSPFRERRMSNKNLSAIS